MGFFTKSVEKEAIQENGGGGKYISSSDIYDINIIAPFVVQGSEKVVGVDFFINFNGQNQPLYGNLKLTNKDGTENFGANLFNKLVIIAGLEEVADPIDGELPMGKNNAIKDAAILEDLADLDIKVRVQMNYSMYNGSIQEKTIISTWYRAEDNASAEEIVNNKGFGEQFEKDQPYKNNVTYKDGLDEEQVKAWIAAKRPKGTAGAGAAATKKPSFGNKTKKFGQK